MVSSDEHPILLVMTNWRERALILSELQEKGYDVRALPGIVPAIGYLVRRPGVRPQLVILDTVDDPDVGERTLRDLLDLTEEAPWIVITSATRTFTGQSLLHGQRITVLSRPLRVEEVVLAAKALLET